MTFVYLLIMPKVKSYLKAHNLVSKKITNTKKAKIVGVLKLLVIWEMAKTVKKQFRDKCDLLKT